MAGKASSASQTRMMLASSQPPKYPAARPLLTPTRPPIATASTPTNSEIREP
jgi:hypothetical protein